MPGRLALVLPDDRRRRLTRRGLPVLGAFAAVSLVIGAMVGSLADTGAERTARDFTRAWERRDYARMHELLTPDAQRRHGRAAIRRAYDEAAATATVTAVDAGSPRGAGGDDMRVPVRLRTRVFGAVRGDVVLPMAHERVAWEPHLAFPEVPEGATLTRRSVPPRRAAILSRDRKVLAQGAADSRSSPLGAAAADVTGRVEPPKERAAREAAYARGFPRSWPMGASGLERAFESRLAGRPGGELRAGRRVLARAAPRRSPPLRTTVDATLQETAVTALAGRFGGVAALDARTAEVRAFAGVAFSAPQPPGSTFKIVTATAALEHGLVKPSTSFPVETRAVIDGVELENANGESCGGSFRNSFAHSCNSVFAPLGVKVGAPRLVEAAERYGFNARPAVQGEVRSTIPPASEIRSPLEVGSTAIGQGKVLATPLRLASISQAVAAGGVRTEPVLVPGARARRTRATTPRIARTLRRLMVDVVAYGTGTAAAIPGVAVAGKTGTAELEDTRGPGLDAESQSDPMNTDAWFTAFAPAGRPRIAVAVMLVRAGAGGETAAPVARAMLAPVVGAAG